MSFGEAMLVAQRYLTFDMKFIDPAEPTGLWFCATAEDVAAVGVNAVKLQADAKWKDLGKCDAFFHAFPYVFVAAAQGEHREQIVSGLRQALPDVPVYIPGQTAFRGCRSAAEFREAHGLGRLPELLLDAVELPVYGLLSVADIEPRRMKDLFRVRSGIAELDKFTGGFYGGQLSLWTGERGLGKSTLLGQLMLEAIEQGAPVCAYSGELDKHQFKQWVSQQAAGPDHVGVYDDPETGRTLSAISGSVQRRIDDWWRKKFYLYDVGTASSHSEDNILQAFDNAARCYGAKVFLVDNIMTIGLKGGRDGEYFRAQSTFAGRLVQFAKQRGVHVHLVAHPRKAEKGRTHLALDDIAGTGDLPNRADNVFALERGQIDLRGELKQVTQINCLKNRMYGGTKKVAMDFDVKSRRFFRPGHKPDREYGWERQGRQLTIEEATS